MILSALSEIEDKGHFVADILIKEDVFLCSCRNEPAGHYCTYNPHSNIVVCDRTKQPHHLNQQQQYWIQLDTMTSLHYNELGYNVMIDEVLCVILLSVLTSCNDGVFSCVDDLRRAAAGVSGDLSRTLSELRYIVRVSLCTLLCIKV